MTPNPGGERGGDALGGAKGEGPLIGVVASTRHVEAQLVKQTAFGRLMPAGRRIVEDVDGPTQFVPLSIERQIAEGAQLANGPARGSGDTKAGSPGHSGETRAGDAWIQSIGNAVAKLTFGTRGPGLRLGLAIDARLGHRGRTVVAARDGARIQDIPGALDAALRGRNCMPSAPIGRAVELGEAWALGEIHSAIGSAGSSPRSIILTWDADVSWTSVGRGRVLGNQIEVPGGRFELGFARLDRAFRGESPARGRLLTCARRGDPEATELLRETAACLGSGAAVRLLARVREEQRSASHIRGESDAWVRLILGGTLGRAAADPRMLDVILTPFERALVEALAGAESRSAALDAGLIAPAEQGVDPASGSSSVDPTGLPRGPERAVTVDGLTLSAGTLLISREDASPCLGAASLALQDDTLAALGGRSSS